MRIRPSWKRMRVDSWRPWQQAAYLGVHTGFWPAMDGCQYLPGGGGCVGLQRAGNGQWLQAWAVPAMPMADPADVYGPGTHCPELNRIPLAKFATDYTDPEVIARAEQHQIAQEAAARNAWPGGGDGWAHNVPQRSKKRPEIAQNDAAGAENGISMAGNGAESARSAKMGPQVRLRMEGGRESKKGVLELLLGLIRAGNSDENSLKGPRSTKKSRRVRETPNGLHQGRHTDNYSRV